MIAGRTALAARCGFIWLFALRDNLTMQTIPLLYIHSTPPFIATP